MVSAAVALTSKTERSLICIEKKGQGGATDREEEGEMFAWLIIEALMRFLVRQRQASDPVWKI